MQAPLFNKEQFKKYYKDKIRIPFNFDGDYQVETKLEGDYLDFMAFLLNLYCIASYEPAFFGKKKRIEELLNDPAQVEYYKIQPLDFIIRIPVLSTENGYLLLDGTHRVVTALSSLSTNIYIVDVVKNLGQEPLEHHSQYIEQI